VINNRVHPSVLAWSIANELPPTAGLQERTYIQQAATLVRRLDPTRPVAMAFQVRPSSHCQAAYKPLDMLGINDYFGWYTGINGEIADRDGLSAYLDVLRRCYPRQALAITEFGAEANRDGPVEEKGTYAFQSQFIQFAMGVYASKPWLTGTDYWTLQEFKVRPDWDGGNPVPDPPMHEKGLISYGGVKKPAYAVLQAIYRAAARRR
jgi:beta-glucuronidase